MRNRLTEVLEIHFGWAAVGFRFSWDGAAAVPGGNTLQDQRNYFLRSVGPLQSPIDGVGQVDDLAGGSIGDLRGASYSSILQIHKIRAAGPSRSLPERIRHGEGSY